MANGRTLEQAEKQLALLAAENRKLAAELEGLQNQGLALEKAARDARTVQAAAEKDAAGLKSKLETSEKQSVEIRETNKVLTAQVARLGKQVEKTPLNPLTVEEASALFGRVIGAFRTSKTLEVKQASLNLKLATAKIGDTAVLLLPDPKSVDPATLHELRIDLTAAVGAELASAAAPPPTPVPGTTAARTANRATKAPARKPR
jgi:uncharacterized protein YigA (DUF484 family)